MRPSTESGAYVVWVEPEDGAQGVFRDPVVLVRISQPVDPDSLGHLQVCDEEGRVPSHLEASADRRVLIWRPQRLLRAGAEHVIVLEGLRDRRGEVLPSFRSRFVCGGLAQAEIAHSEI